MLHRQSSLKSLRFFCISCDIFCYSFLDKCMFGVFMLGTIICTLKAFSTFITDCLIFNGVIFSFVRLKLVATDKYFVPAAVLFTKKSCCCGPFILSTCSITQLDELKPSISQTEQLKLAYGSSNCFFEQHKKR